MSNLVVVCTLAHTRVRSPGCVEHCIESNQKTHFNSYVHVREAGTLHVLLPIHIFVRASFYRIILVGTFYSPPQNLTENPSAHPSGNCVQFS
jgi:hypothetical protein